MERGLHCLLSSHPSELRRGRGFTDSNVTRRRGEGHSVSPGFSYLVEGARDCQSFAESYCAMFLGRTRSCQQWRPPWIHQRRRASEKRSVQPSCEMSLQALLNGSDSEVPQRWNNEPSGPQAPFVPTWHAGLPKSGVTAGSVD